MDFESKIISREISEILWETEKTVGTAESCTGGRIAEAIISVPGASKYYKGGVISYINDVKENLLGVDHQLLEEKTAVCEEVAIAMVKGACKILNTDYAISATGLAGPTGGTPDKPVGTVWMAWHFPDGTVKTEKCLFSGSREEVRLKTVRHAFQVLISELGSAFD